VKVEIEDGKLVSIEADEGHPLGMICRRGQHAPEIVHSTDRLRYPMRRVGPKGTYEFERISWDEAYDRIVSEMQGIREAYGPEAMAMYTGRGAFELSLCDIFQPKEAAVSSASSVLFPFGSANTMGVGALCYVSFAMIAPHVTMGRMLIDMFTDMENAELLVVWGANPATDSPPLDLHRLEAARRRGADVVVIDPRRTETAVRTDAEWVPVRPGTDGALALGMIHVLLAEEIYDEPFAKEWTRGFGELERYVQHFRPDVVEATTGVAAETIVRLARRIAEAQGAAPVMYTGLEYSNSGIQAIRAVLTLFALAGQLDVPGGMGLAMRNSHFPINRSGLLPNPDLCRAVARDRFPIYSHYRGESHALGLVDAVLREEPYPIRGLMIHGGSILTSWPQTPVWRETLSKLGLLVSIDRTLTADAAYADYVLPATTMFEIESYMTYGPVFRIREKIVEPEGEARNDFLILAELAKRLGYGHLYPRTEEELLRYVLEGSGFSLEGVRQAGGTVKIPSPMMEYRKWEKGGLRPDGQPGFDTPSGKFEIASTILEEHGYEPLPKYTEPVEGPLARPDLARDYPLVFNSGARRQSYFRSQHHHVAGLAKDHPEPLVEMHPADGAARGIASGDLVEVSTLRGSVRFRAALTEQIIQGAIECDMGGGGPLGTSAWQASNVNELTDMGNLDEISGFPVYKCLLAEVRKVKDGSGQERLETDRAAERESCSDPDLPFLGPVARKKPSRYVYLDNNATTIPDPRVVEAVRRHQDGIAGNPSSIHLQGREAKDAVHEARRRVARLIGAKARRVVFTGGGSEANNLALKGAAYAREKDGRHIITTTVEHPAVLNACRFLERRGFRVSYADVDAEGRVSVDEIDAALKDDTILVSVMLANNEVGTLQPVDRIAERVRAHGAWMHTDAVQAVGKVPVDVESLGVDLLTLSGHKLHGPKGVGALFVRKGVELEPLIHGGGQESGLRGGTENVPAVAGMGLAAELARFSLEGCDHIAQLRDRLEAGIREVFPEARLNGSRDRRLPNTLNLTLPGLRGESLVIALDQWGVALSSGSACKSGDPEPSHALLAMGLSEEEAHCAVRLSLSRDTTEEDIDDALQAFRQVLEEMETTVRFLPCK
jgi:cysteine desulfurase NifS